MTLTEYIREQARVADANSKEWEAAGDEANMAYRDGMWYAYNDVEDKVSALELENAKLIAWSDLPAKVITLQDALEEARQLLVTASNAGEYGKGDDWAKRYEAWQEAVRVLGVK